MDRHAILAAEKVAVEYIGRKEPWVDRVYGSKLPFYKGQVRVVPSALALRFLRHPDLFQLTEADTTGDAPKQDDEQDDTDQRLEQSTEESDEAREREGQRQDVVDRVMSMEKDALEQFAFTNYQQKLNKRKAVETLRQDVVGFIDQYGVV